MTHRIVIRGGCIVRPDERTDLPSGDLLIEAGKIAAIDRTLPRERTEGAEEIDASNMLVLPGFIDTHRHTWQTAVRGRGADWSLGDYFAALLGTLGKRLRPEDVYAGTLLGALGALDAGVTTLLDWSHGQNSPAHADASIDALTDAGLRAVFAHGFPIDDPRWLENTTLRHSDDLRRIRRERLSSDDALVTLAMAARGPDITSDDIVARDFAFARELGLRITAHVAAGEGPKGRGVERVHAAGLLGPDLTFVHMANASPEALRLMADHGVSASVSPQIELTMRGLAVPATVELLAAGIVPSLSVDSEIGAASDMFTQMRLALAAHRARRAEPPVTARDVLGWATLQGARATGLERRTGSLTVGKDADILLLRATDLNLYPASAPADAVVLAAHAGNVDTVLVAGTVVKRGGRLLADVPRAQRLAKDSLDRLIGAQ